MELQHRFSVPTPVEETWEHFRDVAAVAECFPGATVTSVEGETFTGTCKVKLGPIALVYSGSGTFVERDEAAHRFVVEAKGKDKRGNGTAGANVTLSMADADGGTDVEVLTDLSITGKPAQFGRGVMQDVSDKLLGQFVNCLEQRLGGGPDEPTEEAAPPPEPATASTGAVPDPAAPGASGAAAPAADAASRGPVPDPDAPRPAADVRPAAPTSSSRGSGEQDDALDLGATILPILARTYWKPVLALVVLALLWRWLTRRD